ncbi:A disintegrin and metalloproteinase with thrombospondin motifs 12-like [Haliotis cracherodii]|uniref:A disintegrin and metalloproteinase with thrombospondin motifs 12-like n=1 Tax=Haliotis cracherodii TaxID=6455 RepID=UPI0039E9B479
MMPPQHFGVSTCSLLLQTLAFIVLLQFSVASQSPVFYDKRQENFAQNLDDYEVVIPSRVSSDGGFITHTLHAHHKIWKRSVDDAGASSDDVIHYQIPLSDRTLQVKLQVNSKLLTPSTVVETRTGRYKNVSDSMFKILDHRGCHFTGHVTGEDNSRAAISACGGLMGFVHSNGEEFFIEPMKGHNSSHSPEHPHIIYKRSALPARLDIAKAHDQDKEHQSEQACGVSENLDRAFKQRERWEKHNQHVEKKKKRRQKRSISVEKHVETMVVVDPQMVQHYEDEDINNYVLTVINMVATMFHDATIGNAINIVIVRIILLEEPQEDLTIMHHADKTLRSFCQWQKKMNFRDDDHPNHHDVAILLTRHNICSRMNEPCSTLGLAQVAGMCQPHRTCSVNEDTGLALAFTIAHELGHNFGMKHDGVHNKCEAPKGKQFVMAPHLIADSTPMSWSNCSRQSITQFLDRQWGYCLDDEPGHHPDFKFPSQPAGIMYDTDHQCRLQYGRDAALCEGIEVIENVCNTLWCRVDNKCSTKLQAAAEGTICGTNKWCYGGRCVEIGERPQAINGEWGQWEGWTDCTRSCGAGISYSERHCDNPPPSHGGRYCIGERKRYRICKTDPCPDDAPSFRHVQCSEFNRIPYKDGLHEWEPVLTPHTPCQLHCKPVDKFFSVMLKDMLTDGTPCIPGGRNMCISGRCRHVGCDWIIDSSAVEDRCGVCYGDGSTCKTVKKQFNETDKLGYVEATVIPVGARNIRVEEVAAANNFLALKDQQGKYFLNGHWFIQWSGDYEAAGTIIQYRRHGNKEHFKAAGPLKEPLHIMLLLQTTNPGVVYEYTVPKENATDNRSPEFRWEFSDWSHCTVSCGGGTKRSQVVCVEKEAGVVDEMYCNASSKPDDKLRSCNSHLCPARWWTGPWQHCSVTCGKNGIHRRTVICVRSLGPDEQIALEDEPCKGLNKPTEVEPCRHKDPCPGDVDWLHSEWSKCTSNPCATQTRRVWCSGGERDIKCDPDLKPQSERSCSKFTCGKWEVEDWSPCTQTCDEGVKYRNVKCQGGDKCDPDLEPISEKICLVQKCPLPETTTQEPDTDTTFDNKIATIDMNTDETTSDVNTVAPTTDYDFKSTGLDTQPTVSSGNQSSEVTNLKMSTNKISLGSSNTGIGGEIKTESGEIKLGESSIDLSGKDNTILIPESNMDIPHKHRHNHNHRKHHKNKDIVINNKQSENNVLVGKASKDNTLSPTHKLFTKNTSNTPIHFELSTIGGDNSVTATPSDKPEEQGTKQKDKTVMYWWQTREWSKCSRHCGGGTKMRKVYCVEVKTGREIPVAYCDITLKPTIKEDCHRMPCLRWQTTHWNQCSATCGYAIQSRHVYCQTPNKCDPREKPPKTRECKLQACISWVNGDWSQCSQTCGGGQQVRLVQCVNLTSQQSANGCDASLKPKQQESCNTDSCPVENAAYSITCESNEMSYRVCKMLKKLKHCDKAYVRAKCCRTCGKHRRDKSQKPSIRRISRR